MRETIGLPLLDGFHDSAGGSFFSARFPTLTAEQWKQGFANQPNIINDKPIVNDNTYPADWVKFDSTLQTSPVTPAETLKVFSMTSFSPTKSQYSLDLNNKWKVDLKDGKAPQSLFEYIRKQPGYDKTNMSTYGLSPDLLRQFSLQSTKSPQDKIAAQKLFKDLGLGQDGKPGIGWARWCVANKAKLASMTLGALVTICFLVTSLIPFINDMCKHCIYNPNASPSSPSTADCNASDPNTWGNCLGNNVSTWLPFVLLGVFGCLFCSCCIVILFVVMHKKKHKNSFN